jgi:hypothetical protein
MNIHNRFGDIFRALYRKLSDALAWTTGAIRQRWRPLLLWGVCILIVSEAAAIGFAARKLSSFGVPADVIRENFYLTRYTLNLLLDNPTIDEIESSTNARYMGFEGTCEATITDALLGWRNRPGVACSFLFPTGGAPYSAGLMWLAYAPDGFMVTEKGGAPYSREKPDGVFRIILIGDSALAGFGAPPTESVAAHMQEQLSRRRDEAGHGPRFQVINAGVGKYNSAQQYLYLASELVYYQPDIVVFYNGWTESINRHGHFSDARFAYMRKAKKFKPVPFSSLRMKRHREIAAHVEKSYTPLGAAAILKRAIGRSWDRVRLQTGLGYWTWRLEFGKRWKSFWKDLVALFKKVERRPSPAEAIRDDFDPRTVRVYEENVRRSAALAGLNGFNGLFVLQPVIGVDDKTYSPKELVWIESALGKAKAIRRLRFYEQARPLLASLAKEYRDDQNLCFRDISRVFKDIKERVYVDEGHANSAGHRVVAAALIDRLVSCGFLKLPEKTPIGAATTGKDARASD